MIEKLGHLLGVLVVISATSAVSQQVTASILPGHVSSTKPVRCQSKDNPLWDSGHWKPPQPFRLTQQDPPVSDMEAEQPHSDFEPSEMETEIPQSDFERVESEPLPLTPPSASEE